MCQFLCAVVARDGSIYTMPAVTDSHADLIISYGLQNGDHDKMPGFAKVQFSPPNSTQLADPAAYRLTVEESCAPVWFDESMHTDAEAKLRRMVKRMIVRDERQLLLGGCWILAGGAYVQRVKTAKILALYDSSRVEALCDSSRVEALYDSSSVGTLYGSSSVGTLYGSSSVGTLSGSSRVEALCGSSSVEALCDSSSVGTLYGSSSVGNGGGGRIANDARPKNVGAADND